MGGDVVVDGLGAELVTLVVAEVHIVDGVDGANHVVVPVKANGVSLRLGQLSSVVERSDETALLSAPPNEADLVLEARVLLEGAGDLKESASTGAVVVNTGPGLDRVQVSAENNDVVRVALLGLGDDVPGLALIPLGIDEKGDLEGLTGLEALLPGGGNLERDKTDGHQQAQILGAQGGRTDVGARSLVVENDTNGTRSLGKLELVGNGADTALDERELAGGIDTFPLVGEAARACAFRVSLRLCSCTVIVLLPRSSSTGVSMRGAVSPSGSEVGWLY